MKKYLSVLVSACVLLIGCKKSNPNIATVTFDAGQGYFESQSVKKYYSSVTKGTKFSEIVDNIPKPTSIFETYTFDYWSKDDQAVSEDYVIDSNITIQASYRYLEPLLVTFDFNGGKYEGEDQITIKNKQGTIWDKISKPESESIIPPSDVLEFEAWSYSKDELKSISPDYIFNESITLYAYYRPTYLKFTAVEDNATIYYAHSDGVDVSGIKKSTDGNNWSTWNGEVINLSNAGDSIYVKNVNDKLSISSSKLFVFKMTGMIKASGNVNSMINFSSLYGSCFYGLFNKCTSLISAPSLPAKTLATRCYQSMFQGCTSLVSAPYLPATSLPTHAYHSMFNGCTALKYAQSNLPATGLSFECYRTMFSGCKSLESAPIIFAKSAANNSYYGMFSGCSSLSYIKIYYAKAFNSDFYHWVNGVSKAGTFYYEGASLSRSISSIPESWLVIPRYNFKPILTNCRCEPATADYHSGETVDIKIIPNDGYALPDKIVTNSTNYVYNKEANAFTFLGENKVITLRVDAVKI